MGIKESRHLNSSTLPHALRADAGSFCHFDLARTSFVEPSGLVALAAMSERAVTQGHSVEVTPPKDTNCLNYLARASLGGAWESLGVDDPLPAVRRRDVDTLCELRRFSGEHDLTALANSIITQYRDDGGQIAEPLYQALFEIAMNAVEHSRVGGGWVVLQAYPAKQQVVVAIADAGVGLRGTLRAKTDKQAIADAARKHSSTSNRPGRGRGITSVIELTRDYGGSVTYLTGDATGVFTKGKWDPRVSTGPGSFEGTLVETKLGQRRNP